MRAGRALLEAPGPAYRLRLRALHRGERFFERYGVLAVFVLPSWVAGIERMRPSRFLPANFVSAVLWACGYGIGAYFIGPSVYDLAGDIGTFGSIAIGLVIIAALLAGYVRRRRRRGDRRRPGRTA